MNITTYSISKSIFEMISKNLWTKKEITCCFNKLNGKNSRLAIDKYEEKSKVLEQFARIVTNHPDREIKNCMNIIGKELKESCEPNHKRKRNVAIIRMNVPNYGFRDICANTDDKILIVSDRNEWNNTYNRGGGRNYKHNNISLKIKEPREIDNQVWWQKMCNLPKRITITIFSLNYNKDGNQIVGKNNNIGLKIL